MQVIFIQLAQRPSRFHTTNPIQVIFIPLAQCLFGNFHTQVIFLWHSILQATIFKAVPFLTVCMTIPSCTLLLHDQSILLVTFAWPVHHARYFTWPVHLQCSFVDVQSNPHNLWTWPIHLQSYFWCVRPNLRLLWTWRINFPCSIGDF